MRPPKTVIALLIVLGVAYLLQKTLPLEYVAPFLLWPIGDFQLPARDGSMFEVGFMPWQLVTYSFLHADPPHLLFNALGVWTFGASLEESWGRKRLLVFWFVCVVGAGLLQLALGSSGVLGDQAGPTLGASGGVYGLLIAFAMMYPNREMMLLIPPIPMKARTLAIVFGAIALVLGVSSGGDGIAHFAHLGGMLAGWLLLQYWRGRPPFGRRGPPKRPNLRAVN